MLRSVKELKGYTITAVDDDSVGTVDDFYFDDEAWVIRYLVVDTGKWLPGRKVLISPVALEQPDWGDGVSVAVNLTREEIENSPDIDADKPISRQQEASLIEYYQWPAYWYGATPTMPGGGTPVYPAGPMGVASAGGTRIAHERTRDVELMEERTFAREQEGDPHLRSATEVINYYIEAKDDDIGHVEDFIVEDEVWAIRYMVVDTRNWLPGKKVLVSPQWIKEVNWANSRVYVDLLRDTIKNSPEYDPSAPINRDYEGRLYDHYGRQKYW